MRNIAKAAIAIALAITPTGAALAGDITVPANRSTTLGVFYAASRTECFHIGKPKMFISRKPQHGKIDFVWAKTKVKNFSKQCDGKMFWAMHVVYTPQPGFHGIDKITVGMSYSRYGTGQNDTASSDSATIHVK